MATAHPDNSTVIVWGAAMSKRNRNYQLGPTRHGGGTSEIRYANDEEEAYYALKRIEDKAARERQERHELEKKHSIILPELKLSRATKRTFAYTELAQSFGGLLADAWQTNDPRLAERFSEAMKKACAEYPDDISMAMHTAWESDPELRVHFSKAVSAGLRKMWADPTARRLQSGLIKQTYKHGDLRERRSNQWKKQWEKDRKRWLALTRQVHKSPGYRAAISAAAYESWSDPEKKAQRIAKVKATRAACPPLSAANDNSSIVTHCAICGGSAAFPYKKKWYCDACIDKADKAA